MKKEPKTKTSELQELVNETLALHTLAEEAGLPRKPDQHYIEMQGRGIEILIRCAIKWWSM